MGQVKSGILDFRELKSDPDEYGNKVCGLLQLVEHGCNVPEFYVIAYNDILSAAFPDVLPQYIKNWFEDKSIDQSQVWVVRSSTGLEDSEHDSHAGLFHSELNVHSVDLAEAILKVRESYKGARGGIIIQKQIHADFAGVLFTRDPLEPQSGNAVITLIDGTGEKLVSGEKEGEIFYVSGGKLQNWKKKDGKTAGLLEKLAAHALGMEQDQGRALDIEFCISDKQLYWLQARPITALNTGIQYVWDNANIGENFPGLSLPLTISYVRHTYSTAYQGLAAFIGLSPRQVRNNRELFDKMTGGINGALYYNVTAWQMLLAQLPFRKKTIARLTKTWDMKEVEIAFKASPFGPGNYLRLLTNLFVALLRFKSKEKEFRKSFDKIYTELNTADFSRMNLEELTAHFSELEENLAKNWIIPVLNGLLLMLFYGRLNKIVESGRAGRLNPGLINDIIAGYRNVKSAELISEYFALLLKIKGHNELLTLFGNNKPEEIYHVLEKDHNEIFQDIIEYIGKYGERIDGGELKIEIINYREDPLKFLARLKESIPTKLPEKKVPKEQLSYRDLLRKIYRWNPVQRWRISFLVRQTAYLVANREDHRFLRLKGYHLVRRIFRGLDARLLEKGHIRQKDDSLFLDYPDLFNEDQYSGLKEKIRERKEAYIEFAKGKIQRRYIQSGDRYEPDLAAYSGPSDSLAKGIGCCRGQVEAEVIYYDRDLLGSDDYKNKIVVAKYVEPVGVCQLTGAAGIIMERGNLLSHTAILCRELGIPSIVGVRDAREILRTGEKIIINGSTGEILRNE